MLCILCNSVPNVKRASFFALSFEKISKTYLIYEKGRQILNTTEHFREKVVCVGVVCLARELFFFLQRAVIVLNPYHRSFSFASIVEAVTFFCNSGIQTIISLVCTNTQHFSYKLTQ